MADKRDMSVEEMLAYARRVDGGDTSATPPPQPAAPQASEPPAAAPADPAAAEPTAPAEPAEPAAPASKPAAAKPAAGAPGKKPAEMSIEEIMAAARGEVAGGAAPAEAPAESAPAAPAAKPAAGKKPSEMSMDEILAAARGDAGPKKAPSEKAAAAPAKPASQMSMDEILAAARGDAGPKKPSAAKTEGAAAAKPAATAKPAAAKAAPKAEAKASAPAARDTTSILAGGPKGPRPGPISKAEAAAKGQAPVAAAPSKPKLPPRPQRPDYLEPRPAAAPATRRTFFGSFGLLLFGSSLAVGFSSLFVTNLLWLLGLARFMFPNILIEPPTVFKVGFPGDYAPGQVETKYVAQFGVWIVRYEYEGQPEIFAIRTVCTHLGCTPNWLEGEQKFKCPCHGSGFYKDGINFEGPAPRPLERYAIRLADDGQLEVDKSRKFQEELGQWKDPNSFVTV